jgi:predicted RNA-binding protein with PUA-like domain
MARGYWLLKTDAQVFSFDDLWRSPRRTTTWEGVRNYQARNLLRDSVRVGDGVLIYHSSADPTGIAGLAEVASAPFPDPSQFDPRDEHHDPRSARESPTWYAISVRATRKLDRVLTLAELRGNPALAGMGVLKKGNRLSVQPVSPAEWRAILALAGPEPSPGGFR